MSMRILLVGGTSESVAAARALVAAGRGVLVSQATEAELDYPVGETVALRRGRLDLDGFCQLIASEGIGTVVDASHPFARELHAVVRTAAEQCGVPLVRLERSGDPLPERVHVVDTAEAAASLAFRLARTVLVTTGSRTLPTYASRADACGGTLWARMLPCEESDRVALACGMAQERIAWGRGPFTVEDTLELLRRSGAGVLVAKDSGDAGGMRERLEAARLAGVEVVAIRRPERERGSVADVAQLLERIAALG